MRPSLISFLAEGRGATFVTLVRVHRKCHIFIYFLRKIVSHFSAQGKNIMFSGKSTIFPDNIRKIMSRRSPFGKGHPSRKFEEIIIFTCILLRKIIFHFPSKV